MPVKLKTEPQWLDCTIIFKLTVLSTENTERGFLVGFRSGRGWGQEGSYRA